MKNLIAILLVLLIASCRNDSIIGKWEKEVNVENDDALMIIDFKNKREYFVYRLEEG